MDILAKDTKTMISGVLVSSKFRMTMKELNRDFHKQVGDSIPYAKLGFSSLETYLQSLHDIVKVVGQGANAHVIPVSKMSAHVVEMVAKQKCPKNNKLRFTKPNYRSESAPQFYPQHNYETKVFHSSPPYIKTNNPKTCNEYEYKKAYNKQQNNYQCETYSKPLSNSKVFENSSFTERKCISNSDFTYHTACSDKFYQDESNKSMTSYKPTGQNAATYFNINKSHNKVSSKMPENPDYDCNESNQGTHNTKGYSPTLTTLSVNQGSVIRSSNVERSSRNSTNTRGVMALSDDEVFYSDEEEINARVPQVVQNNLRALVKKYPDGIWCAKVPDLYKKEFGMNLEYAEYGYVSLVQMCLDLGNSFHCIQPDRRDYKLYDKSQHITIDDLSSLKLTEYLKIRADAYESTKPALPAGFEEHLLHLHQDNIPLGVFKIGMYIEKQWLDPSECVESFIDVNVAEVYDPSKFWFNLKRRGPELNKLMDNMQSFYETNAVAYAVPKLGLKVGLYISVTFLQEYHRAVIVDNEMLYKKNLLRVFFIDYGSVSMVSCDGICYLHEQFSELPAQAIRGRLTGIYPPHRQQQWSRAASALFLYLVKNKDLVGRITRIDAERELLELLLADTSDEEDFFINDAIVFGKEHGIFMSEEQHEPIKSHYVPIVQHIHLFPTFDELETGKVPNATQMIQFENAGYPIERIYPHYFRRVQQSPRGETPSSLESPVPEGTWKFDYDLAERVYNQSYSPEDDRFSSILNQTGDGLIQPVLQEQKRDWIKLLSDEDEGGTRSSNANVENIIKVQDNDMVQQKHRKMSLDLSSTNSPSSSGLEPLTSPVADNHVTSSPKISPVPKVQEFIDEVVHREKIKSSEQVFKHHSLNPEKAPFVPLSQVNAEIKSSVPPPPGFKNFRPLPLQENQQGSFQQVMNVNQVHQMQFVLQQRLPVWNPSLIYHYYPNISAELALLLLQASYQLQTGMPYPLPFPNSQPNMYGSHPAYSQPSYCALQPNHSYVGIPLYSMTPSPPSNLERASSQAPIFNHEVNEKPINNFERGGPTVKVTKLQLGNGTPLTNEGPDNKKNACQSPMSTKSAITLEASEGLVETQAGEGHVQKSSGVNTSCFPEKKLNQNRVCMEAEVSETSSIDSNVRKQEIFTEVLEAIKIARVSTEVNQNESQGKDRTEEKVVFEEDLVNQGMESPANNEYTVEINVAIKGSETSNVDNSLLPKQEDSRKPEEKLEITSVANSVVKHELGNLTVHVITHSGNCYFCLEEMARIVLGKPVPNVQIKKMFIGKEHSVSFFDISLKKYPRLKTELLEFNLIKNTALTVNLIAVIDVAQFVKILTRETAVNNFDAFLNDVKKLLPVVVPKC